MHIGKLILLGAIFNCTNDVLTIAATLSTRTPFLSPITRREEADAAKRRFGYNQSDHLTVPTHAARGRPRDSATSRLYSAGPPYSSPEPGPDGPTPRPLDGLWPPTRLP